MLRSLTYFVANNVAVNQCKGRCCSVETARKNGNLCIFTLKVTLNVTCLYFYKIFSLDVMLVTCWWLSKVLRTEFPLFFKSIYLCTLCVASFSKVDCGLKRKRSLLNATHFRKLFQHSFSHKFWFCGTGCESTAFPVMVTLCVMPEPATVLLADVVQRCLQSEKRARFSEQLAVRPLCT